MHSIGIYVISIDNAWHGMHILIDKFIVINVQNSTALLPPCCTASSCRAVSCPAVLCCPMSYCIASCLTVSCRFVAPARATPRQDTIARASHSSPLFEPDHPVVLASVMAISGPGKMRDEVGSSVGGRLESDGERRLRVSFYQVFQLRYGKTACNVTEKL